MDPSPLVRRITALATEIAPVRREVRAYAAQHGVTDPDAVALALSEAVSNAILHAYVDAPEPGEVEIEVQKVTADGLHVTVCDAGSGMKPRVASPGFGVGLPLMASLADKVDMAARPGGGTRVSMVFESA